MLQTILSQTAAFLVTTVGAWGYWGIFILMLIESTFLPIVPAELVLVPAGFLISVGKMSFIFALLFAVIGSLSGALINYFLALYLGRRTIDKLVAKWGKFLFVSPDSLLKSDKYFEEHGAITTLIGRLIIGVRHFISLPAGFTKMNLGKFCVYTSIGAGIYGAILLYLGYLLGNNLDLVKQNMVLITYILFLILAIAIILYILIRIIKTRKK